MKRLIARSLLLSLLCLILVLGVGGVAHAHGFPWPWNLFGHGHGAGADHGAPEIDPSLIGSGLALLGGSLMVIVERYRGR